MHGLTLVIASQPHRSRFTRTPPKIPTQLGQVLLANLKVSEHWVIVDSTAKRPAKTARSYRAAPFILPERYHFRKAQYPASIYAVESSTSLQQAVPIYCSPVLDLNQAITCDGSASKGGAAIAQPGQAHWSVLLVVITAFPCRCAHRQMLQESARLPQDLIRGIS